MTTVRKIIVDSRYFIDGTAGQGTFELSEIVDIHPSQVLYLESYQSVNSWYTIDDTNQNIYVVENPSGGTYNARTTQIKAAPYDSDSFASAFQDALNAGKTVAGSYAVTRSTSNSSSSAIGSAAFRFYTVALTGGGKFCLPNLANLQDPIYQRDKWLSLYHGPAYNLDSIKSSNDLVEFQNDLTLNTTFTSNYVDLRAKHSLCLHSTTIGNLSAMGPMGIRTCIAVMPVTQPYGGMTIWQGSGNIHDFIEPATRSLKRMSFEVRSFRNDIINFQGGHWTAVFVIGTRPS